MQRRHKSSLRYALAVFSAAFIGLSALGSQYAVAGAADTAASRPVVIELFTSQGCSSCPPADKLLGELAARGDVIALAYHVDYWNRLGWRDPYSHAWATQLQRQYNKQLGRRNIFTPQVIVHGETSVIGSSKGQVAAAIGNARVLNPAPFNVELSVDAGGGKIMVTLPETAEPVDADIIMMRYDHEHTTPIDAGENRGRTLKNYNVVRERLSLGRWRGAHHYVDAPQHLARPGNAGLAVIVQDNETGQILGSAKLDLAAHLPGG